MIEGIVTRQQRRAKERARCKHDPMCMLRYASVLATTSTTITYGGVATNLIQLPINQETE